ncbi:restriction endonuclease [Streptomyces rectiviolaceus]|uniref:Restriction endonuclease type IV Mrr domain-containing protein n=1 Tax=Streptomyces rectiviolaceus TaxID=332591 RepID=A0ABP6MYM4_9ACTN
MAARRGRRTAARKRNKSTWKPWAVCGAVLLLELMLIWSELRPYAAGALILGILGSVVWWLWRTDRVARERDRAWRKEEAVRAGHRTLAQADAMTGTEFEELVAGLCRRDGCTEVRRVGGAGDNGADVVGRLPDGRTMVVQCKRYAPSSAIATRELRDLLGSRVHFGADVAIFVTTTRFSRPSETFAAGHGIVAVHRDHLGLWNSGASLESLLGVSGAGQGDTRHRARWKKTYG